jgi:hypothetical protein
MQHIVHHRAARRSRAVLPRVARLASCKVASRGFTNRSFFVETARPPERWTGFTERVLPVTVHRSIIARSAAVSGFADNVYTGEIVACPPQAVGRLLPVMLRLRSFWEGSAAYVSRGVYRATLDGKPKIWAGEVRPAVAVWRRGRQDAALKQKKTQTWTFAFFSTRPPTTGRGLSSPFEPLRDGFTTRVKRSGAEGANPSFLLL